MFKLVQGSPVGVSAKPLRTVVTNSFIAVAGLRVDLVSTFDARLFDELIFV